MAVNEYFIILLIVEIFLYSFHLSMLFLLFAKRKTAFKGPFFSIFRIIVFVDLLNFLCTTTLQKISLIPILMPFFSTSEYFVSFIFSLFAYITVVMFLGNLLMALNRFTLIWFPLKHDKIWKRQWYIFVLLFLPFLHICWRLHEPGIFIYLPDSKVSTSYKSATVSSMHFLSSVLIFFSTTLLAAVINLLTVFKFYFLKSTNLTFTVHEKHLLFVSLITFFAQVARTSYNFVQLLFPQNEALLEFFFAIFPILNDAFALSGSISFLVLSASTRKEYKMFYFCQNNFKPIIVPSHLYTHESALNR